MCRVPTCKRRSNRPQSGGTVYQNANGSRTSNKQPPAGYLPIAGGEFEDGAQRIFQGSVILMD